MDNLQDLTDRTHNLAQIMMRASGGKLNLFTVVGIFDRETNNGLAVTLGWAGEPKGESRAPIIARYKAAQMLTARGDLPLVLSPAWNLGFGPEYDYAGGVLMQVDGHRYVAACSAQSAQTDLLVASTLMYAMQDEVRFNHIGFTFPSEEALQRAIVQYEGAYASNGISSTAGSGEDFHHRYYIAVDDESAPNGEWFIELRWFPNRTTIKPEIHFDVVTSSPEKLLGFLGKCLNTNPELWEDADPGTPVGMVVVENNGTQVALMARDRWFEPRLN